MVWILISLINVDYTYDYYFWGETQCIYCFLTLYVIFALFFNLLGPVRLLHFLKIPTCMFIWHCTFIRDIRVSWVKSYGPIAVTVQPTYWNISFVTERVFWSALAWMLQLKHLIVMQQSLEVFLPFQLAAISSGALEANHS